MVVLRVVTGIRVVRRAILLPGVGGAPWPVSPAQCKERLEDDCCPDETGGVVTTTVLTASFGSTSGSLTFLEGTSADLTYNFSTGYWESPPFLVDGVSTYYQVGFFGGVWQAGFFPALNPVLMSVPEMDPGGTGVGTWGGGTWGWEFMLTSMDVVPPPGALAGTATVLIRERPPTP